MFWKNLKISYKMFMGFGIVTFILVSVLGYSYFSFNKMDNALESNIITHEIISETDNILVSILNMETGMRGYAITGNDEFLEPYLAGKRNYEKHFDAVKTLTLNNPKQQERLINISESYKNWSKWVNDNVIEVRQKVNTNEMQLEGLISVIQAGQGKKETDHIRSLIAEIEKEEQESVITRGRSLQELKSQTSWVMSLGGLIATILAIVITFLMTRLIITPVKDLTSTLMDISEGEADYEFRLNVRSKDELGEMANHFNTFMDKIKIIIIENSNEGWIKTGQTELTEKMRGAQDVDALISSVITYITKYIHGQIGGIYLADKSGTLKLRGSYAYKRCKGLSSDIKLGEGLVGQSALEKQTIIITEIPDDYINISSGLGQATPRNILVTPCLYQDEIKAVIEIGSFHEFTDLQLEFIERISKHIAIEIHSVEAKIKMQELLNKTLEQSEELQAQQEELRATNEELEENTKNLELQKRDIIIKNENLKNAKIEIEEKAKAIEITSKYKSEFLANMSHELRTPLNSILVLSEMLAKREVNTILTDKQLEYANTIHSSGQDLLKLINDVLDLSKVEAGKMDITLGPIDLIELSEYVERRFRPIALQKGIDLTIDIGENVPENIISDVSRVQQIINNLLSNAFKFTHKGGVTFKIHAPEKYGGSICISIIDTGIGIPKEKQSIIFKAFKQSDGTTSRKYGGTGLGLSISREFAHLLGGEIYLTSEEEKGSTFSLVLPEKSSVKETLEKSASIWAHSIAVTKDDRGSINGKENFLQEKKVLVVDDDMRNVFALSSLLEEKGVEVIIGRNGKEGIEKLNETSDVDLILMDIMMPVMDGYTAMSEIRKQVKFKNIPIIAVTAKAMKDDRQKFIDAGASDYLTKPIDVDRLVSLLRVWLYK